MLYGKNLKSLREENDMKQADLARLINTHEYVYGQYEREYTLIPIKHLNTLCNYFKVSIDYIFDFTETKNYYDYNTEINLEKSGLRLKELRKNHNLTQEKLSSLLNIDRSTLAKYEKGIHIIATPFLYTICKKYNISADYLLGKIDNEKK